MTEDDTKGPLTYGVDDLRVPSPRTGAPPLAISQALDVLPTVNKVILLHFRKACATMLEPILSRTLRAESRP